MASTLDSETILKVENISLHFELEHFKQNDIRDMFVSAVTHPIDFFFKPHESLIVLDDISFEIKRGMRLGILGVNGAGKTTLCRCIAGMMVPQKGKIITSSEIRAIFDTGTGIMPELTGRENAKLLARLFFPDVKDITSIVEDAVQFSELGHFIDIPFKQYSKGMQARLMLSLISARSSDILILDEVLDGADQFFQQKLAVRMKKFIESSGATIFVSHSTDQVRTVCDTVMVLNNGKIGFMGNVEQGLEYYTQNLAPDN